jgi:hypothetical protein
MQVQDYPVYQKPMKMVLVNQALMQPIDGEEDKLLHQCVDDVKILKLLANKSMAP